MPVATDSAERCYADLMTIRRITISVPEELAVRLKKVAGSMPVSAWVADRLEEHLEEAELVRLWKEFAREVAPTPADKRKAEAIHRRLTRPARRRSAA